MTSVRKSCSVIRFTCGFGDEAIELELALRPGEDAALTHVAGGIELDRAPHRAEGRRRPTHRVIDDRLLVVRDRALGGGGYRGGDFLLRDQTRAAWT